MSDKDKQVQLWGIRTGVCECVVVLRVHKNKHENNSVEQEYSKREHHILFWIKMATHLWILTIRSCIVKISGRLF